jgi:hypothetical protein
MDAVSCSVVGGGYHGPFEHTGWQSTPRNILTPPESRSTATKDEFEVQAILEMKEVRLRNDFALPSPTNASGRAMRAHPSMGGGVVVLEAGADNRRSGFDAVTVAATDVI